MTIAVSRGGYEESDFADYINCLAQIHKMELKHFTIEQEGCFVDVDFYVPVDITIEAFASIESEMSCAYINRSLSDRPEALFAEILNTGISALIGAIESETLDVKRSHYPKDDRGRLELAKDVAAFANAGKGGVIVIGATTTRDMVNHDVVTGIHQLDADAGAVARYLDALNQLIFPEIFGRQIRYVNRESYLILAILIPPQQEMRKPFIVRGGITSTGRNSSTMFQVPVRKGDSNSSKRVENVHKFLSGIQFDGVSSTSGCGARVHHSTAGDG
ncbi:AlbA family DNA-binding domain-containing protein [Nocardia vaccinii]|uniref:AlbA family DNA-binding domain-containing protein n=1 Tax=Nocardia vaccinii TaxID=1822 RepID=UPI0014710CB5|nr:ATP-binding protein [Nocardia vaccinii]